jgi:WD40 repeat protein
LEFFETIQNSPSQIYHSALPFSPSSSWLHKCYVAEFSQEVKVVKGIPEEWGTFSRMVKPYHSPHPLACWENTIAAGLDSGDIILLDAITGSQVAVLSGHISWVASLTFFPDGTSLVSGSDDKTLKLWDIQTGGVVRTFHGHTEIVCSTSISSDHTTIVSGSQDKTIRLWDTWTGECHHILEQEEEVDGVCFSPTDPQHFISESGGFVQQWDIDGHQVMSEYEGYCSTFSPDGTCFVLCEARVAIIRNSVSGAIVAKCPPDSNNSSDGPGSDLRDCCFSPDGGLVAFAADATVYVWDITGSDPRLVDAFVAHIMPIISIAFSSSSLISTAFDSLIKFWRIGIPPTDPVATNTPSTSLTLAPIQSITLQVKHNIAISSDSAGVVRIWDLSTGLCKAFFQTPAIGNTYRDAQMIDGRLIFVWNSEEGNEFYIWDIEKGEPLQVVEAHSGVNGLRISGDWSKVFCLDEDTIRVWSIWTGEVVGEVKLENPAYLDPFCADGSKIWVWVEHSSVQGWDFGISSSPVQLFDRSPERPHLNFIWSFWGDELPVIEDTVTGEEVFQLSGRYATPVSAQWDGQYLVAGYYSGEVVILDFNHLCVH